MEFLRDKSLETQYDKDNFIGKIFQTNNYGKVKIIGIHSKVGCNRKYIVEFLDNGHQQLTYKSMILKGDIKNNSLKHPKIGKIYSTTRCGDCMVLEVYSEKKVQGEKTKRMTAKIRFLNTGYEGVYILMNIVRGEVEDPYARIIYGVGYHGKLSFKTKDEEPIYRRWHDMIERVYKNGGHINYTDVVVCDRWHCLQNFYEDFFELRGYDNFIDIKQENYGSFSSVDELRF